jgi:Spy/CpxP family protein refolding chaperone
MSLKWKLAIGFILVFVAGGMTGAFVVARQTHHMLFGPNRSGVVAEHMRHRLRAQLQLTDDQMKKISPIIDQTAEKLETIRTETGRRVHETFAESHREIANELTPEQQAKLQKMDERRHKLMRRFRGGGGPPPEPPGPTGSPE